MAGDLPVTLTNWLLAFTPLAVLLVLLLAFRWSASQAAGAGFLAAALTAAFAFAAGVDVLAVATIKGLWDGLFILYVIWPALVLFETVENAGAFEVFREGLERLTRNRLILVLALGWLFASFLQSVAGFGTPIAIIAPILIGLGVRPVPAVVIPLLGQAWANVFGTLGVPWLTLLRAASPESPEQAALYGALIIWVANLLGGLAICWIYGRGKAVVHALPFVATISLVHGAGQAVMSTIAPPIAALVPTAAALGVGALLGLVPKYRRPDDIDSRIMAAEGERRERARPEGLSLPVAIAPYALLVGVALVVLLVPPVNAVLERVSIGLPLPETQTGLDIARAAEGNYGAVAPLTHPGTFLLLAAALGYWLFKRRGAYGQHGVRDILRDVATNAVPASISVLGFLSISAVMDHAGMVTLLAAGVSAVAPAGVYAGAANAIGAMGTFMTSSTTASNALFGPLQSGAAERLGLDQSLVLGAHAAGAGAADAIAPANLVLGTGTARIAGKEADVLHRTLPWMLTTSVLMGAVALLLALVW